MSASAVIGALRARLEAADYAVTLFRTIDAEHDELPLVAVHFAPDGEQTKDTQHPYPEQRFVELDVLLVDKVDEDHEVEAVEAAETLRDTLITHRPDKLDNLDGSCGWAEIVRMRTETRVESSDAIVSHVRLRAHY